jgi:hypothetical protein
VAAMSRVTVMDMSFRSQTWLRIGGADVVRGTHKSRMDAFGTLPIG